MVQAMMLATAERVLDLLRDGARMRRLRLATATTPRLKQL